MEYGVNEIGYSKDKEKFLYFTFLLYLCNS